MRSLEDFTNYSSLIDMVIQIVHHRTFNFFFDINGKEALNIFDFITPNDLYLYRQDPGHSIFPYKKDPNILCEIIAWEECGIERGTIWKLLCP